jgi:hypothetical protein
MSVSDSADSDSEFYAEAHGAVVVILFLLAIILLL